MNLNQAHMRKVNSQLQAAIEDAKGDEILRAVMILAPASSSSVEVERPGPAAFDSREDYRRALIALREREIHSALGPTLEQLTALSLNPRGGSLGHAVVVEGTVEHLVKSLELPGVVRAVLDQPINLVEPVAD